MNEILTPYRRTTKRVNHWKSFNHDICDVFWKSENKEIAAEKMDKMFHKLLRFISYTNHNITKLWESSNEDINLLKKFINSIKSKLAKCEKNIEQKLLFGDICLFLNGLNKDPTLWKIHNSIPTKTQKEFSDLSLWNQLLQTTYPRNREIEKAWDWASCSYRTLMIYNFFTQLKEAWLDLDISIFRFNNLHDKIDWYPSMRHSWVLVRFQWKDYLVDYDWTLIDDWSIIKPLDEIIKQRWKDFFANLKFWKQENNKEVTFFDNKEDLLKHIEKLPEYKKIAFNVLAENDEHKTFPLHVRMEFFEHWLFLEFWDRWFTYFIKNSELLDEKDFFDKYIQSMKLVEDWKWCGKINDTELYRLKEFINMIKDKVNTKWLYKYYSTNGKFKSELVDMFWTDKIMIMKEFNE